jgi:predicted DNA-binding protein (UPF0251 family)
VVKARDGELCCSKCGLVLENADAAFMAPPVGRPLYPSEAENAFLADRNLGTVTAPSRLQRVQAAVGDKDLEALLKLLAKKVRASQDADGRALTDALGRIARSALSAYRSQHQTIPTAQLERLAEKAVNRFLALYPQAKSVVHVRRGKPGRPKALTLEQVKTAQRLLAKGYSIRQAAAALGVKRSTLHNAVRKLSVSPAYPPPFSGQGG